MEGWWVQVTWHTGPMLAFDVESTGVNPEECHIVQASIVTILPKEKPKIQTWLINPGVPIPPDATAIHGITDEIASKGMAPAQALAEIADELDCWTRDGVWPVIAFNASFDFTVLNLELRRHDVRSDLWEREFKPIIDPFVIDRAVDKYRRGKRTLGVLCEHYDVSNPRSHSSAGDALAAARLSWRMAKAWPELAEVALDELHERQRQWYQKQSVDFKVYLERLAWQSEGAERESIVMKIASVNSEWPMRKFR